MDVDAMARAVIRGDYGNGGAPASSGVVLLGRAGPA